MRMRSLGRRRRGGLMMGMAGIIVLFAALTGLVMQRSGEIYAGAVQQEQKLQALAAAESAVAMLQAGVAEAGTEQAVGAARFTIGEAEAAWVPVRVEVMGRNGRPVLTGEYRAHFAAEQERRGTFLRLERVAWTSAASR